MYNAYTVYSYSSAAVADGGQWMGCISSMFTPFDRLVWDTLEEFSPLRLHMWDKDSTLHARTWTKEESVQNDRRASQLRDEPQQQGG